MVQLIDSVSRICLKFRVWGDALFKQLWTWYLRTLQNNSLRNSWHSCPSRQTKQQRRTVKTWDCWFRSAGDRQLSVELFLLALFSMHWKSCASRSALPSSSTGWKKNKIRAVLEVSWWFLYFRHIQLVITKLLRYFHSLSISHLNLMGLLQEIALSPSF